MGVLDEHNRQHTYGNSLGPPDSVVGVSAQSAIDAHNRLVQAAGGGSASATSVPTARSFFGITLVCACVAALAAWGAYAVGGIGAVAIGLIAVIAALFGVVFLVIAVVQSLRAGTVAPRRKH